MDALLEEDLGVSGSSPSCPQLGAQQRDCEHIVQQCVHTAEAVLNGASWLSCHYLTLTGPCSVCSGLTVLRAWHRVYLIPPTCSLGSGLSGETLDSPEWGHCP